MSRTTAWLSKGVWRDKSGAAAAEFVVIAPAMILFLLAVVDLGNAAQQWMTLQEAVRAGGEYAINYPTDTTGIQQAVTNALPSGWTNVTVSTPVQSCACWTSAGGATTSSTCTCSTGTLERFVSVSASRPYTTGIFVNSITSLSSSYVARYQ